MPPSGLQHSTQANDIFFFLTQQHVSDFPEMEGSNMTLSFFDHNNNEKTNNNDELLVSQQEEESGRGWESKTNAGPTAVIAKEGSK